MPLFIGYRTPKSTLIRFSLSGVRTVAGSQLDYMDFKFISFTICNSTNQLYYSKGYRTTRIRGLFCIMGYLKERI
jgi:hypothetical protein